MSTKHKLSIVNCQLSIKCNKGFSLIELVVSFAILAIASLAIVGLMSSGMRFYRGSTETIGLQYEYQTVMTQLREYVVDCNGGIVWDDTLNALYIVYVDDDGSGTVRYQTHVFVYDAPRFSLGYLRTNWEDDVLPAIDFTQAQEVSARMTGFNVESDDMIIINGRVASITPEMSFDSGRRPGGRSYSAKQGIAMRNRVYTAPTYADLEDILIPAP